ncbi:peptidoglycan editing factor PgeF [Bradyrhizobium sp. SZCCHNS3002]|uniref:peptidoglycan editing factor PgeF n=1 Tax=Bradyrhizobium sp. SZCCHNS3002 TaxID=3057310 RepID=UPI0028EB8BB9|nr:peptidoglycan editing factor PgeF [Bradyrhizobium sp. SZCCHNS3002]
MKHITSPLLSAIPGVVHGFFTRQGGVSKHEFATLNGGLASGDDAILVQENRRIALNALGIGSYRFVNCFQIHSAKVWTVEEAVSGPDPRADAMVTNRPSLALTIFAADCVPVLIASKSGRSVAAAHIGWRGCLSGIVANVLGALRQLSGKQDLVAAIGPSIRQMSYQVSQDVFDAFRQADPLNERFFLPDPNAPLKWLFDLSGVIEGQLCREAVEVWVDSHDTCSEPDLFFSARRSAKDKSTVYGRMMSIIALHDCESLAQAGSPTGSKASP